MSYKSQIDSVQVTEKVQEVEISQHDTSSSSRPQSYCAQFAGHPMDYDDYDC